MKVWGIAALSESFRKLTLKSGHFGAFWLVRVPVISMAMDWETSAIEIQT